MDFHQAYNRARPGQAFSNHTEYELWRTAWCDRCQREAPYRAGLAELPCALTGVAELGRIPAEWFEQASTDINRFHCVEYRPPGGGAGPPRPKPEPPQEGLFPQPPRAVRTLAQGQEITSTRVIDPSRRATRLV